MEIKRLKYSHLINENLINKSPVIIDAGACIGGFTDVILNLFEDAKIFLIEPCKTNIEIINEKYKNKNNIFIYDNILTGNDSCEFLEFNEFKGLEEWGNAKNLYKNVKSSLLKEIISYNVKSLKISDLIEYITKKGYELVDYLKMDIEGYEQEVIRSIYTFNIKNIKQISMEIHSNVDVYYIEDQLKAIGYKTIIYSEGELYASMEKI